MAISPERAETWGIEVLPLEKGMIGSSQRRCENPSAALKRYSSLKRIVTVVLGMASTVHGQRMGDEWTAARGDETPGLRYFAATTTSSGRIVPWATMTS